MKKIILLLAVSLVTIQSINALDDRIIKKTEAAGHKNLVKINLFALALKNITVQYEREISKRKTTNSVDANGATVKFSGPWAGIRAGLCIGFRF